MGRSGRLTPAGARAFVESVLDLIYPPSLYCNCCGNLIDETRTYNLCDHCIRHIRWDQDPPRERDGMRTLRCAQYGIYERTLIFSLKYNGHKYIARDIAEMMRDRLEAAGIFFDVIVPVPMNPTKERARGFNQAALIAKHLGRLTGADSVPGALRRTRDTRPMRGLSPTEREENIRGSIEPDMETAERIRGRTVLLLDDFYTTGATALECRKALMHAEPADVIFIAFAAKY
ncbi:MAG: ComF family protein [Clostridiales bacterium]|uniref:ComF family protein n=1 Tax=Hornefia butyriciproducens TaxID=2652293 RepID=UPI0029F93E3E|nr:ComF family protein [Hornefia butyriciproducens]MCI7413809.1 ComF family protein [Clostridiales bacterium]MCI7679353.1 ComF family protein [Clostridiales bacterium]MDD7020576.1 ComF family protein [Hornefia butyriciproducens]MDY5463534.1 ComF family protein [Hornefia butyriciproducens]MDY6212492.1 ComF family protein [Hornefia butyriciproducens]